MHVRTSAGEKHWGSYPDGEKLIRAERAHTHLHLTSPCLFHRDSNRKTQRCRKSILGGQPPPALTATLKQGSARVEHVPANEPPAPHSDRRVTWTGPPPFLLFHGSSLGANEQGSLWEVADWSLYIRGVTLGGRDPCSSPFLDLLGPSSLPQVPSIPGSLLGSRVRRRLKPQGHVFSEDTTRMGADVGGHAGVLELCYWC